MTVTKAATGETWLLKNDLTDSNAIDVTVNFVSNNTSYTRLKFNRTMTIRSLTYYGASMDKVFYFDFDAGGLPEWTNDAYRTITFATAPTGTLLTWLQANGTKQGGGVTEHTLTCTDDAIIISVNGSVVTSPYTLQNGDTIVLKRASSPWYSAQITAGDNTYDTDVTSPPITISNSDIFVSRGESNNSPSLAMNGFTIDYTA